MFQQRDLERQQAAQRDQEAAAQAVPVVTALLYKNGPPTHFPISTIQTPEGPKRLRLRCMDAGQGIQASDLILANYVFVLLSSAESPAFLETLKSQTSCRIFLLSEAAPPADFVGFHIDISGPEWKTDDGLYPPLCKHLEEMLKPQPERSPDEEESGGCILV